METRDTPTDAAAVAPGTDDPGSATARSDERDPRTRYAHLTEDGTGFILAGSLVAGIGAYAYQFLGGRVLGAEDFAPVSVLLTIHFLTFIVILLPIEQLLIRRLTLDRSRSGVPAQATWLAVAAAVAATVFAAVGVDRFLNGDLRFAAFAGLTVAVHALFAIARGHLAGWRRFRSYGLSSGAASLVRLMVAVAVLLVRPSASGFALGLIAGPLVVLLWKPFTRVDVARATVAPEEAATVSDRGLLAGLVLSAAASQALLLAGPIVVGFLGASQVELSIVFATFTLGRAPLTFGYNLLARILPPFTEMAARGERRELRAWARGMGLAATVLSIVGGVLGWLLGPWLVQVAFGSDFRPARIVAALVAAGVVYAGAGLFVGQILVARSQAVRLGAAWFAGVAAAAATVVIGRDTDEVVLVAAAFVVGEIVALAALVAGAVAERRIGEPSWAAYALTKRSVDIAAATVLLVLTFPLMIAAAIAVKLDSKGPAFFRQERVGRSGTPFAMVKLRTMRADGGEDVFAEHLARLEAARHDETIAIDADPRVTRVGRALRRTSLDELPNLWNVLKGSMSLVGPRPLVFEEAELIGLDNPRFRVKPGVTGLAQVRGRDALSLEERTALDEEYVRTRTLGLDATILLRTAVAVVREPGE